MNVKTKVTHGALDCAGFDNVHEQNDFNRFQIHIYVNRHPIDLIHLNALFENKIV